MAILATFAILSTLAVAQANTESPNPNEFSKTYMGSSRSQNRVPPGTSLKINQWSLEGAWNVLPESVVLEKPGGRIVLRFHARDLNLVLGPGKNSTEIRFKVTIDGQPPAENHGIDVDMSGAGIVNENRLYRLIRQKGPVRDRTFEIEFLEPGVESFAFTFD